MDAEHFLAVWLMNEEEAKGLIRKALDADRVIHAQQLGLPWAEPDGWFLHNVGPVVHRKKKRSAQELAQELIAPESKPGLPPNLWPRPWESARIPSGPRCSSPDS